MSEVDQLTVLPRREVERVGRRQSLRRALGTVLALLVILLPVLTVALDLVMPVGKISVAATRQLSLIIDTALVIAIFQFAWRCLEVARQSDEPSVFPQTRKLIKVIGAAAASHMIMIGIAFGATVVGESIATRPVIAVIWLAFWLSAAVVVISVVMMAVVALGVMALPVADRDTPPSDESPPAPEGTIICCSGGGIRSASFCLGALQTLQTAGIYGRARAVVGVSGGGYVAAALHILRWRTKRTDAEVGSGNDSGSHDWNLAAPPAFSAISPEFSWLRRHTRVLFDSARMMTVAGQSILFGMATNLFWATLALGAATVWVAWLLNAAGGLTDWTAHHAREAAYGGSWAWVGYAWAVPTLELALFGTERCVGRLRAKPSALADGVRALSVALVWSGLALAVLLLGLPLLLVAIHNYTASHSGGWAAFAYALGLVPASACSPLPACGVASAGKVAVLTTPWGSLIASVAAILAVVRGAVTKAPGAAGGHATGLGGWLAKIPNALRHVVVPWLALLVLILVALSLSLRWIASLTANPDKFDHWLVVVVFAGIALALRLFTDANLTSLHHFYRERLSYTFLQQRIGSTSRPLAYQEPLRFSQSRPADNGPELVACAVANVSDIQFVPADRRCIPFVFDAGEIGLTSQSLPSRMAASTYEFAAHYRFRNATLPAAMAISGAAFSPLVGREQARVAPYRLVLALANARLGVWMPNPLWVERARQVRRMIKLRLPEARSALYALTSPERARVDARLTDADQAWVDDASGTRKRERASKATLACEFIESMLDSPGPFRLFKEGLGRTSVYDRRLYLTDGGHYDNLGLVEALRRRPERIFVLDASNDPVDSFRALGQAVATAQMDLDCTVSIDPAPMASKVGKEQRGWVAGDVLYADSGSAKLYVLKAIKLPTMKLGVRVYADEHAEFPHRHR